jgi:hypothetical protein
MVFGSFTALLVGGLIYILFRTSSLKMFAWYETMGFRSLTIALRKLTFPFAPKIPEWILFSLPDGLWIFSYVNLMLCIWNNVVCFKNLFWVLIIPLLAIGSEIGQGLGLIPGTFDLADLLLYILGMTLPFLLFTKSINLNLKLQTQ